MDINHDTGAPVSLDALFGAVLRAFRKRGLRETAAKIPINFSYLAKWERGERPVPQEMVAMLDQAYAANGTLITLHELIKRDRPHAALAGRTIVGALPSGTSAGDGGVRRAVRRLLPTISAATATPIDALQALAALEDLTGGITATLVERDGIDPERLVWECGLACCTARPGAALARLTLDYARLARLLTHGPAAASVQTGLLRAAAQLAALSAMQWSDVGQQAIADRYWQLAGETADSGGERELRVWVRGWQARYGAWAGRPAPALEWLIEETIAIAGDAPSLGLALAYITRAMLAAERGQAAQARVALENFHTVADRLPTGVTGEEAVPLWGLPVWARAYHRAWPSVLLGEAAPVIDEATKLCPADFPGYGADLRLFNAYALLSEGDSDRGLKLALAAVQTWPLTAMHRRVLARLLEALPGSAHTHPTACLLRRLITDPAP